ncbi:MAG: HesA/MoeB/ThiF family protein [Flavobacteriaceae bacterium]|nr:HesA/MoeB/ThiF family protein [Flavobacteriaceae bacterium]
MTKVSKDKIFQRQTTLQEIGTVGQQKFQDTKITIVGCGGLGSVAAIYLAASGIGHIQLIDYDVVDESNLHRQVFYKLEDIGKPKAEILSKYINSISSFVNVSFTNKAISKDNVVDLIAASEIILDCTDSLPIKYLLNDVCVLQDKVLVYGSLYKFDGYVATFNLMQESGNRSANLRDAFPEIPTEKVPNCSEMGTLNTIVGIIALMQANEVLKIVAGIGGPIINELLIFNSLDNSQFKMKLKSKAESSSDQKKRFSEIFKSENYQEISCEIEADLQISQADFKEILKQENYNFKIISVITDAAQEIPFTIDAKISLSRIGEWISNDFEESNNYIFVCKRGVISMAAVEQVKKGFKDTKLLSLEGGVLAF